MGASAWADATPRPASRPSRTVIIANVRRSWETTCMTRKPLTITGHCLLVRDGRTSETVPLCFVTSCPSENRSAFQRQPLHPIARTTAEDRHISDAPVFTPYHRAEKTTHESIRDSRSTRYGEPPLTVMSVSYCPINRITVSTLISTAIFSICSATERAGKSDVRESAVSIRSGCYGWRHQCPVWANVSAKPNMVRSGSHHSPTAKDSAVEESGICWFFRRSQKTGQPGVVAVLWVDVGQFDRQSAGSVSW